MNDSTIYDVARSAGVATSTVSRAFNNPGRLRESTRQHVLKVAAELGYQPNPHAQALLTGRTRTIAMVVSDITNPHYFDLIRGAELRARSAELTLVLVNAEESPHNEFRQIKRLADSVDGFLLAASRLSVKNLKEITELRPTVLLNRQVSGLASATLDPTEGCRQILGHLASFGHETLAYIAGPSYSWMAKRRWTALSAEAKRRGIAAHRVGPFSPVVADGPAAADEALLTGASAFVAHNDLLAISVMRRLDERGLSVPGDISLIGFDNIFAADLCNPRLTTLGGTHERVARIATDLLIDQIRGNQTDGEMPQLIIPAQLIVRDSSGTAATTKRSRSTTTQ